MVHNNHHQILGNPSSNQKELYETFTSNAYWFCMSIDITKTLEKPQWSYFQPQGWYSWVWWAIGRSCSYNQQVQKKKNKVKTLKETCRVNFRLSQQPSIIGNLNLSSRSRKNPSIWAIHCSNTENDTGLGAALELFSSRSFVILRNISRQKTKGGLEWPLLYVREQKPPLKIEKLIEN